jgi:hypothetical protein
MPYYPKTTMLAFAAAIALSPRAEGALTVYTSYSAWAAAVGQPIHPITFQAVQPPGPYSSGITIDTVLFEGLSAGSGNGYLYQTFAGYCAPTGCLIGPGTDIGGFGATDGRLRSTLAGPGNAIGFDYGVYHSAGDVAVFTFSNGDSYTVPSIAPNLSFLGFISSTTFSYADLHISVGSSAGDFPVYDTVYIPTGVPEPSTAGMILAATLAAGIRLRRSKSCSPEPERQG